jgi:FkbM family methyltransferase
MVNFKTISSTLKTTKNFWQAFLLKKSAGKRKIAFRNGVSMEIDSWAKYYKIRDFFQHVTDKQFKIEKVGSEFVVSKNQPVFSFSTLSVEDLPLFRLLLALSEQNWNITQTDDTFKIDRNSAHFQFHMSDDGVFDVKSDGVCFVGPVDSLESYFLECERGLYDYEYKNKTVLDVGGFCGETAVFFASRGAKKIVIYEPVKAHHEFIRRNVAMNAINAELHEEGMGEKDGTLDINYEATDMGFGPLSKGKKTLTIKTKSAQNIISQSRADIAKIDCEGAEISLVGVPKEILRIPSVYIIETHTKAIQNAIAEKFAACGFVQPRPPEHLGGETAVVYFERIQA